MMSSQAAPSHSISVDVNAASPFDPPPGPQPCARQARWLADTPAVYRSILERLPSVFAWEEAGDVFMDLAALDVWFCQRRLAQCFEFISRHDPRLARSMQDCYESMPEPAATRFAMAPETFQRIYRLPKEPVESIRLLCGYLNAESVLSGVAQPAAKRYWTALGDFYVVGNAPEAVAEAPAAGWHPERSYRAPLVADAIPVDFFSPNVAESEQTSAWAGLCDFSYSPDETVLVIGRLERALSQIAATSPAAARLVKAFVRVIIPHNSRRSGRGSSSSRSVRGRVLVRGVLESDTATLANALVHESIHQLMYVLELEGQFVMRDPGPEVKVKSLWTGNMLELHSFFHACFVWYGLANFWALAGNSEGFRPKAVIRERNRSLAGFRDRNPVDVVIPHTEFLRADAMEVAATLQDRLRPLVARMAVSTGAGSSESAGA